MTDERWEQLVGMVKDKFDAVEERTEADTDPSGRGTVAIIEFVGPMGRMQLRRSTRPRVLDKRTHGSNRIGSQSTVEYIYSDTDMAHEFSALVWNPTSQDWKVLELDGDQLKF